ncbi:Spy/CpxP family protein refolding chaperone [Edaphobacter bradus]|uniref:Spy/CpxP family protein refolding chaperone n=1 Tax=Edaphobacter bradus TaxID=2259016 RepID=UPI0021E0DC27|nr:Spy/CpxP family protein refolding chaperone [Edaphobacter bradus]
MKTAPVLIATILASLCCLPALGQQPAPEAQAPPATMPAPPAPPDAPPLPRKSRVQTYTRVITTDGMHSNERIAPPGIWWKNSDLIQKLAITPDQQKRMNDIFQQSRIQLIDLKANVEKQEVTLEPMLDANPPDTNKVLAQIDKIAQARAELEKANARMLLGIRTVLTPDQWTKLQAEERGNRRFMIMHKGGPGGFGVFGGPGGPDSPDGHFRFQPGNEEPPL